MPVQLLLDSAGEPDGRLADAEVDLSLVVPAYKETERLPTMMTETLAYLGDRKRADPNFIFEVIVIDDGSKDGTAAAALQFADRVGSDVVKVLQLTKNRGKGGAVKMVRR